ncbi:MAG: organomercurial lyase [Gemmatimonadaceae bacterium]
MIVPNDMPQVDAQVRLTVYELFATGEVPTRSEVARRVALTEGDVAASYERLADAHVLVLDPLTREVWMAMPFSAVPTAFRVVAGDAAWWANCAWDALGIAAALHRDVRVETTCADCRDPMVLTVTHGDLAPATGIAHFAVPAADWWKDIGFT